MSRVANNSIRSLTTKTSEFDALSMRGYNIGTKIGEGSYATVISANCKEKNGKQLHLACKIINKLKAPMDYLNKFFPRELDILMKIDHPNIVQVHSILERGPKIFIFMQFAENGDLLTYILKNEIIGELQSKAWFLQMGKALTYLHNHDIAHRDLKCENILLSQRMNIKLADFGFARFCTEQNGQPILSRTYCGSAAYAAPEVVGGHPYDPKLADVWSLGVILFIMLNKKMPFDDRNVQKLLKDQMSRKYTYRRKYVDQISEEAKSVVRVLLEPEPNVRWDLREILNSTWLTESQSTGSSSFENI
ncbi:testis-specific serine/threonine-protein kinase 1 [Episyrphus balteatus]|uniref:testis-specific serine/threonine-protein kinase 1 n=1 Tax=Episyrphus balteatus TaxID=286459 RepID=UPI002485A2E8|nr:testis-specific serine/threonine-protein kinase 1 [Episyrphus balteatus]